jgi:hypothetical protein
MFPDSPPPTPEQIAENRQNALNATHYPSLTLEEAQALIEPLITATLEPTGNVLQLQKIK